MITYVNGDYYPSEDAKLSVHDRGVLFGDGVYEIERTYGGVPFKVDEHIERLRRSMRYVEIDTEGVCEEVRGATADVVAHNADAIRELGDVWIHQIVTRGTGAGDLDLGADGRPSVIVMLRELSFAAFAPLYTTGVELSVSLLTRHFAGALDPRVKATSRLAWTRADRKANRLQSAGDPAAGQREWPLVFNDDGTIAEAVVSNICILSDGHIVRPPRHQALEGISLQTFCDLAGGLGIETEERRIALYDLINADAVFMTGTSYGVLPVVAVDGIPVDQDEDLFSKVIQAWIELVDFDFVAQARELAAVSGAA
jgi:branched-chain amino acid aminotransferase